MANINRLSSASRDSDKATLVLHEGIISGHPGSDSVALGEGQILAHGRFAELKSLVGPRTHLIRLAGRFVMPGFIDCHQHFMEGASVASGLSLLRCRSMGDLLADLRVAAGRTPPGNWLRAFGCDEALMLERRGPTREELDLAVPKNPLRLRHQTLHASWLNTRAIAALGLEKSDFKPPQGGLVVRDASGGMNGLVVGMEEWISSRLPRVTQAELESRARTYSRELAAAGITSFTDATVRNTPEDLAVFARFVRSGAICQRVSVLINPSYLAAAAALRKEFEGSGVSLLGVKFMNVAQWEPMRLMRAVIDAMAQGLDCAFHCTEVEELEAALAAIESARAYAPQDNAAAVCRVEHGGLIPPEYPHRIAQSYTWVVTNPGFLYYRGAKYAGDPGLIRFLYRGKSLEEAGINVAAGTDAPVTPARPLVAMAAAATRVSMEGYELAPQEKIPVARGLRLFTESGAQLSRLRAGAISPGYAADLIVLPADPVKLQAPELVNLPVDLTIVGGRVVYERGRPLAAQTTGDALFSA